MARASSTVRHARYATAAALLLAYAYGTIGVATLHLAAREDHRNRVRATLHSGESEGLVCISLARADTAMLDYLTEDEFRLDGHLYDVVERAETRDSIRILCFDDVAERDLEITFAQHIRASGTAEGTGRATGELPRVLPHNVQQVTPPAYMPGPGITRCTDIEMLPPYPLLEAPHPPPRLESSAAHSA